MGGTAAPRPASSPRLPRAPRVHRAPRAPRVPWSPKGVERKARPETEVIMSPEPCAATGVKGCARALARTARRRNRGDRDPARIHARGSSPREKRSCRVDHTPPPRVRAREGASTHAPARDVLFASQKIPPSRRARVNAARSMSSALATASIVEKFALALEPACGGINHGTVRNVLDSSRASGRKSTLHAIDRPFRIVVAGQPESARRSVSDVPRTRPSRSDPTSVGCMPREDQGGPQ